MGTIIITTCSDFALIHTFVFLKDLDPLLLLFCTIPKAPELCTAGMLIMGRRHAWIKPKLLQRERGKCLLQRRGTGGHTWIQTLAWGMSVSCPCCTILSSAHSELQESSTGNKRSPKDTASATRGGGCAYRG